MTDSHLWAGIDVGKEHHWICVLDASGEVVLSRRFANDEKEIISVITDTESLGDSVSWTVDLTTVYATLLLTVLTKAGTPVRYLSGRSVWQASTVYRGGEAKTDARDARVIADQSRMRSDLPVLHPDDELIRELQMLTGHRADLVADRTRTINRLRQQLVAVCPGLERVAQISSDRGGWVVLLTRYQRPKAIRRAGGSTAGHDARRLRGAQCGVDCSGRGRCGESADGAAPPRRRYRCRTGGRVGAGGDRPRRASQSR